MHSLAGTAGLILTGFPRSLFGFSQVSPDRARGIYSENIVIDCLANPGSFNVPWPARGTLSPKQLENVKKSGITAVNITVSSGDFESTVRTVAHWQQKIREHADIMRGIRTVGDIRDAKKTGRLGLIFGFQDGEMIGRDLRRIDTFYNMDVRIIQLTYNKRNFFGDGCLESDTGGLSNLGREAVERMNQLGITVDLSHCNAQTTDDGIAVSNKPVICSHSGCRNVYDHPRNKWDKTLRALADRGGVIGIFLMPYLGNNGTPYSTKSMFYDHLTHALNVCGTDHVGIGSDLSISPVVETPEYLKAWNANNESRKQGGIQAPDEIGRFPYLPDINDPRRIEIIAIELARLGYNEDVLEKVIGGNFHRVFGEIWI